MKVLIAEDNLENRKLLRCYLDIHDCEVIEAEDGQEALELAKIHKPELIISDALMPRMDGFQFLRNIKKDQDLKNIPFIFYSAVYTENKESELAESLGAEAFIAKPKEPEEFWEEVRAVLDGCETKGEKSIPVKLIEEEEEFLRKYSYIVAAKLEEKVRELERTKIEAEKNKTEE
jgi:CheY-like chemotaxis protein